ncbi:MAG: hypothetical protein QGG53_09310 [Planctomycetota bacterium]|jgi:hypothetical protein|nr:hypothetical protein [Planctomycetota bacterium]
MADRYGGLEQLLENRQFNSVRESCFQGFKEDCYDTENTLYLARSLIGELDTYAKGRETAEVLNYILTVILQFGAVPEEAFNCFFPLFEEHLNRTRRELPDKGQVVLVIGTGRNGSTSIATALKRLPASFVTHERAPIVFWNQDEPQLNFQIEFFELARKYFEFVIDVSHWWLPHLDYMRDHIDGLKVVNLHRPIGKTLDSFERIKEASPGLLNHWTNHHGSCWDKNLWDKCYPNVIDFSDLGNVNDPLHMRVTRLFCTSKYISDYHAAALNEIEEHRGLSFDIESLFSEESKLRMFAFLDREFDWVSTHLNEGDMKHSQGADVFSIGHVP